LGIPYEAYASEFLEAENEARAIFLSENKNF